MSETRIIYFPRTTGETISVTFIKQEVVNN